ncbi:FixH family protein [Flavobacterium sp. HXWNR69]|uniref:FixH family protein n=1 Tax=Flavobacterium fragile TaxID=2949085 RepID=A0ABT0TI81_9FLAO|nr:FixH family protein [Flavobacterium sp. HXWNR69]MCL9770296.1 FixH family protein [Flavobacterium sp. HXWNR69]
MKFNWGTGIVIAFALFMTFILSYVFKVQSNDKYDHELVVEDYYKKESTVQSEIERQENANALLNKVKIEKTSEGVRIEFPSDFDYSKINGKVSLYRPSSQKLDFEIPLSLSSPHLLIPKSNLASGLWDISIDWEYDGVKFLNKDSFKIE